MAEGTPVRRRALSIAVGSFEDPERELDYAPGLSDDLRAILTDLEYECLSPPDDLSSESIGATITDAIEASGPDDILLVHLITHAEKSDDTEKVYALGPDEVRHRLARIDEWLTSVQDEPDRPLTLFLLDVCYAGNAARLPWQSRVGDGTGRAWVIGACAPDRAAFDGRLTQAVVNVVAALRRGELDLDAALRHAPFVTVARAIGQEVKRLTEESDGLAQQATGSLLDITAIPPDLPFFPNPAYPPSATQQARADVDAALAPFLDDVDEALDAAHFFERAAGGPQVTTGCFSGRREELRRLVPWMQGYGKGPLRVVTGSPGVGKSALLGILVCSAHQRLRGATSGVWQRVDNIPPVIERLAAVHARKRGSEEIRASLVRQLGLGADDLVASVAALDQIPLIVIDALDEADRPDEVMDRLLLPLVGAVREDGRPACRLLVGARRWGLEPLLDQARASEGVIDLDDVDRDVLYNEIETYVYQLLQENRVYRRLGAVRGAFAAEVAKSVSAPPAPDEERWGEFLVAGLYTRHFISGVRVSDPKKATALGARVPRTLPEVFALDLSEVSRAAGVRSLLTVLAYAQGEGMPAALAIRGAAAMDQTLATTDRAQWDAALETARFYLRRATDVDGTTVYRIFHEGLAEHLREASPAAALIHRALMSPLDSREGRRWDLAEPYLLRHAPDHAHAAGATGALLDDVEFLVYCDAFAIASLAKADPSYADLASELLTADLGASPAERRRALAVAATRTGRAELLDRLAKASGRGPLHWRPVWATERGTQAPPTSTVRLDGRLDGHEGAIGTITIGRLDKAAVVVTGGRDGTLRLWDLATHTEIDVFERQSPVHGAAVGGDAAQPVILSYDVNGTLVAAGLDHRELQHLLVTGEIVQTVAAPGAAAQFVAVTRKENGQMLAWTYDGRFGHRGLGHQPRSVIKAALGRRPDGTEFVVTANRGGEVLIHELGSEVSRKLFTSKGALRVIATGEIGGRSVVLTGEAGSGLLRLRDELTGGSLGTLRGHTSEACGAAIGRLGDRVIAVTAGHDRTVRFWDLRTLREFAEPREEHMSTVRTVALSEDEDGIVAVTGAENGSVLVWRLRDAGRPSLIGVSRADDVPVALLASGLASVLVRDLPTGAVLRTLDVSRYGRPVALHPVGIADRQVPVLHFEDGSRVLWDLADGLIDVMGVPMDSLRGEPPGPVMAISRGQLRPFDAGETGFSAMTASQLSGRTVLFTGADETVGVWDVDEEKKLDSIDVPGGVRALKADPSGYLLVDTGSEVICFAHSSTTA